MPSSDLKFNSVSVVGDKQLKGNMRDMDWTRRQAIESGEDWGAGRNTYLTKGAAPASLWPTVAVWDCGPGWPELLLFPKEAGSAHIFI